jgi:hypothetical protein
MASVERYIVEKQTDQVPTAFRGIVKLIKEKGIAKVTLVVPKKGGCRTASSLNSLARQLPKLC